MEYSTKSVSFGEIDTGEQLRTRFLAGENLRADVTSFKIVNEGYVVVSGIKITFKQLWKEILPREKPRGDLIVSNLVIVGNHR